jgi:hypothetical protein
MTDHRLWPIADFMSTRRRRRFLHALWTSRPDPAVPAIAPRLLNRFQGSTRTDTRRRSRKGKLRRPAPRASAGDRPGGLSLIASDNRLAESTSCGESPESLSGRCLTLNAPAFPGSFGRA